MNLDTRAPEYKEADRQLEPRESGKRVTLGMASTPCRGKVAISGNKRRRCPQAWQVALRIQANCHRNDLLYHRLK